MPIVDPTGAACSIRRSLALLGERWSLLILREAALGVTRSGDFQRSLGIASDVLAARLTTLVDAGVLERAAYQDPGSRERTEYRLTAAGREATVVLGALSDWGATHLPTGSPSPTRFTDRATGERVRVAFVSGDGQALPLDAVVAIRD